MSNIEQKVLELNDTVRENLKKLYMILAGLQIVKLVLWFMNTFVSKVTVEQLDYNYNKKHSFYSVYAGGPIINIIVVMLSVLTILLCVYAICKMCVEKRVIIKIFKPIMIASCIHYVFYLLLSLAEAISNNNNFTQAYGAGMGEVYSGPNIFGIIQLIAIVASTIIVFMISSKTKAIANWEKSNSEMNESVCK